MGAECCSGRYSEIDNQIAMFWEHIPLRKMTIIQYTDFIRSTVKKVDLAISYNYVTHIVDPLLKAGDNEQQSTYSNFFEITVRRDIPLHHLLLALAFLTDNRTINNNLEITQAFLVLSSLLNLTEIYSRSASKGETNIYARRGFLNRLISDYLNMISLLSIEVVKGVKEERLSKIKQEFDHRYQEKFKECYIILQESEVVLSKFIDFNFTTLSNDNEIRRKLSDLYKEDNNTK
jgi:hypothetical protein